LCAGQASASRLDDVFTDPCPEHGVLHPADHAGHPLVGSVDGLEHMWSQLVGDDDHVLVAHQLLGHMQVMLELVVLPDLLVNVVATIFTLWESS
jgi:hypothetical protein